MRVLREREEPLLERGRIGDERAQGDALAGQLEAELLDRALARVHANPVAGGDDGADARVRRTHLRGARVVGRAERVAARRARAQLVEAALVDDAPGADDGDPVAELLDLVHEVAREQHGDAAVGERADERAHVAHAGGIEPGRGLVEQQQGRAADQRPGDAEALAHAVRIPTDAVLGASGEVDRVERLVDV